MSSRPVTCCVRPILLLGMALSSVLLLGNCGLMGTAARVGVIKLQFGCLVEGTPIDTPNGPVPVEQLEAGDMVVGYGGTLVTVRQIHQYREDASATRHLTVQFVDGGQISLSPRHRICGIPAGHLEPGQEVGGRKVAQIRPLTGVTRSFDLLTDDAGYRIHGIPVDSMIEEMRRAALAGPSEADSSR